MRHALRIVRTPGSRPVPLGTPRRRARGFSLIEVLVAFVVLALVATALFRLYSAALANVAAAEDWTRALLVAQSQLEAAAAAQPLREASERGTDATGRVQWETHVAPHAAADVDPELERQSEALATRMYRITVDVKFEGANGRARTLSLATIRLGARNPG